MYTYNDLYEILLEQGCSERFIDMSLGRMMDIVEEQTGNFPKWTDNAPEWIVKNCL